MKKRILPLGMVLELCLGLAAPALAAPSFPDVDETAWYAPAVRYAGDRGDMAGDGAGLFRPEDGIIGAEFARILYNRAGRPSPAEGAPSRGGVAGKWYASAVLWAAGEGILSGGDVTAVGPEKPLTRRQIALMLYNAAGKLNSRRRRHPGGGRADFDERL